MGAFSDFCKRLIEAKGASPNAAVPAPRSYFNYELRYVTMFFLAIKIFLQIINISVCMPFLAVPSCLISVIVGIISVIFTVIGLWGVFRLIPEWMKVYAIWLVVENVVELLNIIFTALQNVNVSQMAVFYSFHTILLILFLFVLKSLYRYALALRGNALPR